jgi:hypothetical protein
LVFAIPQKVKFRDGPSRGNFRPSLPQQVVLGMYAIRSEVTVCKLTDEVKILAAALAASVVTVGITEPLRGWFQRRRIRRWLYREMIHNCEVLSAWVHSTRQNPGMREHTAVNFTAGYRKLAYEMAVKDAGFYSLRGEEPYRIDGIYRDFDRISTGSYRDPHDCFVRAETAAAAVFLAVQDRALSRWTVFRVSTGRQKRYLRENLPRSSCTSTTMMRRDGSKYFAFDTMRFCSGFGEDALLCFRLKKGPICHRQIGVAPDRLPRPAILRGKGKHGPRVSVSR